MKAKDEDSIFDLYIIGGGINGVGVAVDAAGRGLKVGLCEKGDLANATSSASSKLIHGGLRYLEQYDFRLVKEALAEREILLKLAPHIAWPLRFCLPHRPQLRPFWMIRAGLFLYDNLSSRVSLKGSKSIYFDDTSPLQKSFKKGFEYSDAWIDDARLVILNAIKLQQLGGTVKTRTEVVSASRNDGLWQLQIRNVMSDKCSMVKSLALVNATGPWVSAMMKDAFSMSPPREISLIKGSHIVVPKIHDEDRAYLLQNDDKRIVFVLPYEETFSLIGTTDVVYHGDPSDASCSRYEIDYLCNVVNQHFKSKISKSDIVWTYAGVRPLCADESDSPQAITRDYTIEVDAGFGDAPLLSIFGGKLTTYRKLGEAAMEKLAQYFPGIGGKWTSSSVLPGGEDIGSAQSFAERLANQYPWLTSDQVNRFSTSYGSLAYRFLKEAVSANHLGEHFGAGLTAAEVDYLINNEWACTSEDILWRRSKMGLKMSQSEQNKLNTYVVSKMGHHNY
ncbi:MAG: glycerol-3-phosphate dehydrogenase [Candidatus Endonucleobacter sp. (ex Gigantidas childressi)]|nr:glycerol-3-phosphate dehydrogenase [Candidatus Endonucleobacter sp. (ex Gigantidas childressi)]